MTSTTPLLISGFYTGVGPGRYRIFDLHQSYLRVSGGSPRYVYCTGPPLPDRYRKPGIRYLDAKLAKPAPVPTMVAMARTAARMARAQQRSWFVSTHADIWGPRRGWARRLITLGLEENPRAELITFAYGERGYMARLFAARPAFAELLFDEQHAARYEASRAVRGGSVLYETYLRDCVIALGATAQVAVLESRTIRKKGRRGSRSRTMAPAHPGLAHDHSHVYDAIRASWQPHGFAPDRGLRHVLRPLRSRS